MQAKNNFSTPPATKQNDPKEKLYKGWRARQIRARIGALRQRFGDCLNAWPADARREYTRLERELRTLEQGNGC